jgi:hypothetical protein
VKRGIKKNRGTRISDKARSWLAGHIKRTHSYDQIYLNIDMVAAYLAGYRAAEREAKVQNKYSALLAPGIRKAMSEKYNSAKPLAWRDFKPKQ